MVYNMKINIVQNNYLKTLGLDRSYVSQNGYIVLAVFIGTMFGLYSIDADLKYFALSTSVFVFARYKLKPGFAKKEIDHKHQILPSTIFCIWGMAIGLYFLTMKIYL